MLALDQCFAWESVKDLRCYFHRQFENIIGRGAVVVVIPCLIVTVGWRRWEAAANFGRLHGGSHVDRSVDGGRI